LNLLIGNLGKRHLLGKVLCDQTIGIFIQAAFPRTKKDSLNVFIGLNFPSKNLIPQKGKKIAVFNF